MRRLLLLSFFAAGLVNAGVQNALPSCYDYAKLARPNGAASTELFIMVDQTTPLDNALKQSVADTIRPLLRPGNAFSVMQFSAYTQGHYAQVLVAGQLDKSLNDAVRNDTSKPALAKFDQCLTVQARSAMQLAGTALRKAFSGEASAIDKSDVLASLRDLSMKVKQSQSSRRIVLVVSDMLENSSISTFYSKKAVRNIEVDKELKLAVESHVMGDFGGAEVYVIGTGMLSEEGASKGVYRDPKTMAALQQFWASYFARSNARLVELGMPALLNPIR